MALTQAQKDWLKEDNQKIVLCDIQYHNGVELKLGTFANYPYILQENDSFDWTFTGDASPTTISNISYIDNLINVPTITSKIDSNINVGLLEFINAEGEYDDLITYAWEGHPIRLYLGDPSWVKSDFIQILDGISSSITSPRPNIIGLNIRDKKEVFNAKLQTNTITWTDATNNYLYDLYEDYNTTYGAYPFTQTLSNAPLGSEGIKVTIANSASANAVAIALHSAITGVTEFASDTAPSTNDWFIYESAESAAALIDPIDVNTGFTISVETQGTDSALEHIKITAVRDNNGNLNGRYFYIYSKYKVYLVWISVTGEPEVNPGELSFDPNVQESFIPETTLNSPVPVCLGSCFNIEPVLIDHYNHTYQIHEGPISAITEVRSNGVPLDLNTQVEINLTIGCFRLLVHENNTQITCDVTGALNRGTDDNNQNMSQYWATQGTTVNVAAYSAAWLVEWIALEKTSLNSIDLCPITFDYINGVTNTAVLGLYVKEETDIANLMVEIMASIGGFARFGRGTPCVLQLFQVTDPDLYLGTVETEITEDDVIEKGIALSLTEPPKNSITLGYRKNWTVQDASGLAGLITDVSGDYLEEFEEYVNEFSKVSDNNSGIKVQFPLAEDTEVISSYIYSKTDAQAEVTRRINLRDRKRYIYKIESTAAPFVIGVGDFIDVTHRRFGFQFTKTCLVVGLVEQPTKQRVTLEVWL